MARRHSPPGQSALLQRAQLRPDRRRLGAVAEGDTVSLLGESRSGSYDDLNDALSVASEPPRAGVPRRHANRSASLEPPSSNRSVAPDAPAASAVHLGAWAARPHEAVRATSDESNDLLNDAASDVSDDGTAGAAASPPGAASTPGAAAASSPGSAASSPEKQGDALFAILAKWNPGLQRSPQGSPEQNDSRPMPRSQATPRSRSSPPTAAAARTAAGAWDPAGEAGSGQGSPGFEGRRIPPPPRPSEAASPAASPRSRSESLDTDVTEVTVASTLRRAAALRLRQTLQHFSPQLLRKSEEVEQRRAQQQQQRQQRQQQQQLLDHHQQQQQQQQERQQRQRQQADAQAAPAPPMGLRNRRRPSWTKDQAQQWLSSGQPPQPQRLGPAYDDEAAYDAAAAAQVAVAAYRQEMAEFALAETRQERLASEVDAALSTLCARTESRASRHSLRRVADGGIGAAVAMLVLAAAGVRSRAPRLPAPQPRFLDCLVSLGHARADAVGDGSPRPRCRLDTWRREASQMRIGSIVWDVARPRGAAPPLVHAPDGGRGVTDVRVRVSNPAPNMTLAATVEGDVVDVDDEDGLFGLYFTTVPAAAKCVCKVTGGG